VGIRSGNRKVSIFWEKIRFVSKDFLAKIRVYQKKNLRKFGKKSDELGKN
jgi:hypothetical protein